MDDFFADYDDDEVDENERWDGNRYIHPRNERSLNKNSKAKRKNHDSKNEDPEARKKLRRSEALQALENRRERFIKHYGSYALQMLEQNNCLNVAQDYFSEKKNAKMSLKRFISMYPSVKELEIEWANENAIKNYIFENLEKVLGCTCTEKDYCENCIAHMVKKKWIPADEVYSDDYMNVFLPTCELYHYDLYFSMLKRWKRDQSVSLEGYYDPRPLVEFEKTHYQGRRKYCRYKFRGGKHGPGYYRKPDGFRFQCIVCGVKDLEPVWGQNPRGTIRCKGCDMKRFTKYYKDEVTEDNMMEYLMSTLLRYELSEGSTDNIEKQNCLELFCSICLTNKAPAPGACCASCTTGNSSANC